MNRSRTFYPDEEESSFFFLSDEGDIAYTPVGYDADLGKFSVSIDDSRLPRSSTINTSSARSTSLPANVSPEDPTLPRRSTFHHKVDEFIDEARLGLPPDWVVFPVSKRADADTSTIMDGQQDRIDFSKFDYSRPLEFSVMAESSGSADTTLPPYRYRESSLGQTQIGLPSYTVDKDLPGVIQKAYAQNKELLKRPKLKRARPLPHEFTEEEIREIRRKTRHRIRVVTRNSLGLTVTLGLSCVAPQMLIAAAINGFLLGRGAYKLHQHLKFLRWNELRVQKRDVVVAVIEGAVVKLIFIAITVNHDDFLVLTHELVHQHSEFIASSLHHLPGFSEANHLFITPIEKIQEVLGFPTMAQQAVGHAGSLGFGGWLDPASTVLKNMFFVGAVQTVMEVAIDRVQDHLGFVSAKVRDSVDRTKRARIEPLPKWSRNRELMFKSGERYDKGFFRR